MANRELMWDLVTLGEVLLRLAIPSPARFETTRSLDVQIGGAEANVAAAVARLGLRSAWISALPDNPWGERARRELSGHGVDCSFVRVIPGTRMGVYYLEYGAAPRPIRVLYDRGGSAFTRLGENDVDWTAVRQARIVHLTGVTPALGPNGRALAERVLREASTLSFDVNYRAALWSPSEARGFVLHALPRARYVFVGLEEARTVLGLHGPPEEIAEAIASRATEATVNVLMGNEGALTLEGGHFIRAARPHVQVVDPVGAGDAFAAGFLWASLRGLTLRETANVASAVAALKCSTWGDIALITPGDVAEVLAGGSEIRR